ncbi:MAG: hypothetical protein WD992_01405 [Candidatus Levyibacteriota bacterium]
MKSINLFLAIALIIVAGTIGYVLGSGKQIAPTTQVVTENIPEVKLQTLVLGEQNNSGQVGVAVIREEDGKVKVNLRIVGQPDAVMEPAHIHTGSCPTPGAIVYPLTNVVDGESETILETTWDALQAQKPLAINVHESETILQNYVSCGDL